MDAERRQGPLGVPLPIARELVRDCVRVAPIGTGRYEWIAWAAAALLDVEVEQVAVHESRGANGRRYADVTVFERDATRFRDVFPEAAKLRRRSRPGTAVFRLRC